MGAPVNRHLPTPSSISLLLQNINAWIPSCLLYEKEFFGAFRSIAI